MMLKRFFFLLLQLSSALIAWVHTYVIRVSNEGWILSMTRIVKALCSYDGALLPHRYADSQHLCSANHLGGGWWEYSHKSQLKNRPAGVSLSNSYTHIHCQHALTHSLTLPSVMNKTWLAEKHIERARNGKCLVEVRWDLEWVMNYADQCISKCFQI